MVSIDPGHPVQRLELHGAGGLELAEELQEREPVGLAVLDGFERTAKTLALPRRRLAAHSLILLDAQQLAIVSDRVRLDAFGLGVEADAVCGLVICANARVADESQLLVRSMSAWLRAM